MLRVGNVVSCPCYKCDVLFSMAACQKSRPVCHRPERKDKVQSPVAPGTMLKPTTHDIVRKHSILETIPSSVDARSCSLLSNPWTLECA